MGQSINLIPQEEKQAQVKIKLVKSSTVFSGVLLFIVIGVSVFYFYKVKTLNDAIDASKAQVEKFRQDIKAQSDIEITARNLATKSSTLEGIYSTTPKYSLLLKEFKNRVPAAILVDNLTLNPGNTISISGTADNYISIASFVTDLTNTSFPNAQPSLEALFTSVTLNTVSLESKTNRASYFINISFDPSLLTL